MRILRTWGQRCCAPCPHDSQFLLSLWRRQYQPQNPSPTDSNGKVPIDNELQTCYISASRREKVGPMDLAAAFPPSLFQVSPSRNPFAFNYLHTPIFWSFCNSLIPEHLHTLWKKTGVCPLFVPKRNCPERSAKDVSGRILVGARLEFAEPSL